MLESRGGERGIPSDVSYDTRSMETVEQLGFLQEISCATGQGFPFMPAVWGDRAPDLLGRVLGAECLIVVLTPAPPAHRAPGARTRTGWSGHGVWSSPRGSPGDPVAGALVPRRGLGALLMIAERLAFSLQRELAHAWECGHGRASGLGDACPAWQAGGGCGSSPIRAAARNLTRVRHYFESEVVKR